MKYYKYLALVPTIVLTLLAGACQQEKANTLRVSEVNPRYFTDNTGKAIYLTGSHTWDNLVEIVEPHEKAPFDYAEYLRFLKNHNHNFFRLWTWDLLTLGRTLKKHFVPIHHIALHPWERSGDGLALDTEPKFDLEDLNQEYFDRMRERVIAAGKEDIYVAVMLFEGWGLQFSPEAFKSHPFHPANNVNGITLDTAEGAKGFGIYELGNETITRLQEAYVRKVIETVGDLDNVLYEISNENHPGSTEWQYHMVRFIKEEEQKRGISHPVGMTFQYKGGKNEDLFASPADWISPNPDGGYRDNPPAADGAKVILSDTDHLWGIGGNRQWVWKSFLRGLNPIFMDPYRNEIFVTEVSHDWEEIRVAMGQTRDFAEKMDLINMVPADSLATSGYCLANAGKEYLVYLPDESETTVNLTVGKGVFTVAWFDTRNGAASRGDAVTSGSEVLLTSPFGAEGSVVHLRLQ